MRVGGQRNAPGALPPEKTRNPLYRRLGGHQSRSGLVRNIFSPTRFRSPDRPARSESLVRWVSVIHFDVSHIILWDISYDKTKSLHVNDCVCVCVYTHIMIQYFLMFPILSLKVYHFIRCSVTRLGEDWLDTSCPRRRSKYPDFIFRWLLKLIYRRLLLQECLQLSLVEVQLKW